MRDWYEVEEKRESRRKKQCERNWEISILAALSLTKEVATLRCRGRCMCGPFEEAGAMRDNMALRAQQIVVTRNSFKVSAICIGHRIILV